MWSLWYHEDGYVEGGWRVERPRAEARRHGGGCCLTPSRGFNLVAHRALGWHLWSGMTWMRRRQCMALLPSGLEPDPGETAANIPSLIHSLPTHQFHVSTGGHVCGRHLYSTVFAPGSVLICSRAVGHHSSIHCGRYDWTGSDRGQVVGRDFRPSHLLLTPILMCQCAKTICLLNLIPHPR
jgi:hypothetical protein